MNATLETPSATDPRPPVCATLALANIKAGRTMKVAGATGKPYEFKWNEGHQKLVREYTSADQFSAEEADIRKNQRSQYVVTTLLGASHPVHRALESLAALITSHRQVHLGARLEALKAIVEKAQAEITRIETPIEEVSEDELQEQPPADRRPAVDLRTNRWTQEGTGIPIAPPVADRDPSAPLTKPIIAGGLHTQEELMRGQWDDVKAIARGLGLPVAQTSRIAIVAAILEKEAGK